MIPRHLLPQIPKDQYKEFVEFMDDKGIKVKALLLPVKALKPIQAHVNRKKVDKLKKDKSALDTPIIISKGGFILDGHHRWLAQTELDGNGRIACIAVFVPLKDLIRLGHAFDGSFTRTVYEVTRYGKKILENQSLMVRQRLKPVYEDDSYTDCRSETGVTVGLIDGLIATLRVLKNRNLNPEDVKQALLDLGSDEDLKFLLSIIKQANG